MTQQLIEAPLAATAERNWSLCGVISLSHGCGGILVHSSFQRCFSSLRFAALVYAQLSLGPTRPALKHHGANHFLKTLRHRHREYILIIHNIMLQESLQYNFDSNKTYF